MKKMVLQSCIGACCALLCLAAGLRAAENPPVYVLKCERTGEKEGILRICPGESREDSDTAADPGFLKEAAAEADPQEEVFGDGISSGEGDRKPETGSGELFWGTEEDVFSDGMTAPIEEKMPGAAGGPVYLRVTAPDGVVFTDPEGLEAAERLICRKEEKEVSELSWRSLGERIPQAEDFDLQVLEELPEDGCRGEETLFSSAGEIPETVDAAEDYGPVTEAPEVSEETGICRAAVTADRSLAGPGDLIRWHICLQNTGTGPLEEVLVHVEPSGGLEDFVLTGPEDAGRQADGSWMIPKILPGQVVDLEASAVVSRDESLGAFWIETVFSTKGSGVQRVAELARVEYLASLRPTASPTPVPSPTASPTPSAGPLMHKPMEASETPEEARGAAPLSQGYSVYREPSEKAGERTGSADREIPKTGDDTPIGFFFVLILLSAAVFILIQTFRSH